MTLVSSTNHEAHHWVTSSSFILSHFIALGEQRKSRSSPIARLILLYFITLYSTW